MTDRNVMQNKNIARLKVCAEKLSIHKLNWNWIKMGGPPNLDLTRLLDPKISTKWPPEFKIRRDCRIFVTLKFCKWNAKRKLFQPFFLRIWFILCTLTKVILKPPKIAPVVIVSEVKWGQIRSKTRFFFYNWSNRSHCINRWLAWLRSMRTRPSSSTCQKPPRSPVSTPWATHWSTMLSLPTTA